MAFVEHHRMPVVFAITTKQILGAQAIDGDEQVIGAFQLDAACKLLPKAGIPEHFAKGADCLLQDLDPVRDK